MPKKLLLIDGANCIFRAFFALPVLTNSKGLPVNALLGFSQMMLKLIRDEKPDYAAVVFDTKEPTFRDEIFKGYKANRKEPPDDLVPQFEHFPEIVSALGLFQISKAGFEADDIIGTLASKCASKNVQVLIISSDKDLFQLISSNVLIKDTMKDKLYTASDVVDKLGVKPERVVDYLSLTGDSSDNIPGAKGIGPKTASKLISEFGSLDKIIENISLIRSNAGEKIKENIDNVMLSKKLAQIDTNVSLNVSLDDMKFSSFDKNKLIEVFKKFEFKRLIDSLQEQLTLI